MRKILLMLYTNIIPSRNGGNSVFVSATPDAIPYGHDYPPILKEKIAQCDIFLLIVTGNALSSGPVGKEVQIAQRLNKLIIPCRHSLVNRALLKKWGLGQTEGPTFTTINDLVRHLDYHIKTVYQRAPISTEHISISEQPNGTLHVDEISGGTQQSRLNRACWMAYDYIKRGNYPFALEWANKATEIDHDSAYAWQVKGVALGNLGRYNEAIQSFDIVLRLDPNDPNAWRGKGWTLEKLGNYNEAKQYFERARQLGYDR
jgi:tetratricopeptide (TPR) repeat protein